MPKLSAVAAKIPKPAYKLDYRYEVVDETTFVHKIKVSIHRNWQKSAIGKLASRWMFGSSTSNDSISEAEDSDLFHISIGGITFSVIVLSMMIKSVLQD
jgi:hypothetical protein